MLMELVSINQPSLPLPSDKGAFIYYVNKTVGGSLHEKITYDDVVAGWVFTMIT